MKPRDFTFVPGSRDTFLSLAPPYTSPTHQPTLFAPAPLPSAPHPSHAYATFVPLAAPSRTARVNGLEPVAISATVGSPIHVSPPHSPRLPFSSIPQPHDPLLSQLNRRVTAALEPLTHLHQQLSSTTSSLTSYLSHSTTLLSSLSSLAPTTTLSHYTSLHSALLSSSQSAATFFSIEVLYPLTDWLDDASQCTIELGQAQTTRHQLDRVQDELQQLFEMKLADAVPPSIDELIEGSKEGLERLSSLYSGQVEGVQKSVKRVMDSRARVLEVIGRKVMEWEWKVMKRWRSIEDLRSRQDSQHTEEDEERADDALEDEEEDQPVLTAPMDEPSRIGQSRRYSHSLELVKTRVGYDEEDEEEETELTSTSLSRSSSSSTDSSDSMGPTALSPTVESPLYAQEAAMKLSFPYKAPYPPSTTRLHALPFPALPVTSALSSSVWLNMFSAAYKWDEARDELVSQYEVREGAGRDEVEKAFKRRKSGKAAASNSSDKLCLLSEPREAEVDQVMKRLGLSAPEVVQAILSVDTEHLTADRVQQLINILPIEAETETLMAAMAQSADSSVSLLDSMSPATLLLSSLISPISPSLITRLRCLHFHYQLPALTVSLMDSFSLVQSACVEVRDSTQLQHVLASILEVFNYLHPKEVAYAFDLTLLSSLATLSTPTSPSFLTFLVSHLSSHFPQLLPFPSSLPSLHRASLVLPSALSSQHATIQSSLTLYRQMLDDLDASSDITDRSTRLGWIPLYEKAVEAMERVEKRMMAATAKADAVCRWLCWEGRKGELKEEEQREVEVGRQLFRCDVWSLLHVLEGFVVDFLRTARKEERRRRRRDEFKVNVREEMLKAAMVEQQRRQKEEDRKQAVSPPPTSAVREYDEETHPAVYSPHRAFSELHERHSPPVVESMMRAPSMIRPPSLAVTATSPSDAAPPSMLSQVFRESKAGSGGTSPLDRMVRRSHSMGTPIDAEQSKPLHQRTGSFTPMNRAGSGGMTPVEFVEEVLAADLNAKRDSGGGGAKDALVNSGMYSRNEAHDVLVPTAMPVNTVRIPFSSHFTYRP